jgi:flagellum-specific peptidoglycan hydrolase FlgJ
MRLTSQITGIRRAVVPVRPATVPARVSDTKGEPQGGSAAQPEGMQENLAFLLQQGSRLIHFGSDKSPAKAPAKAPVAAPSTNPLEAIANEARRLMEQVVGAIKPQTDWNTGLPPVGIQPAPAPAKPAPAKPKPAPKPTPKPVAKPKPAPKPPKPAVKPAPKPAPSAGKAEALKHLSAAKLAELGRTNKKAFLEALRPAAEEAEKKYGVPAEVTMAQAALETGWGQHIIPGFNIFGIKGTGPAGTVAKGTWEVYNGKKVTITANFAKYHNFYEAVFAHGKLFHNGYYDRAVANFKKFKSPERFAQDITGTYATDPAYGAKLISIMKQYKI